jgi:hypothetical protein
LYVPAATVVGQPAWHLQSAVVAGRDLLDEPAAFGVGSPDPSNVLLTLSTRRAGLTGAIQHASGQPAPGHSVILFPANRGWWRSPRRLHAVRSATDGQFSFAVLPGGDYRLAAVNEMPIGDWRRPAFLEQALAASIAVTIAEGSEVRQDLRIP